MLPPLEDSPVVGGKVYFATLATHCTYEPVATMLPAALEAGDVAELTEAEYVAAYTSIQRPAHPTPSSLTPAAVFDVVDT